MAADDQVGELSSDLDNRDPALERLLPTAHRGDEQVASEFRRLTEHDLRDRKAAEPRRGDRSAARRLGIAWS